MGEDGLGARGELDELKQRPLLVERDRAEAHAEAPYFAEEVRRQLIDTYGDAALYEGGLSVRTSVDPKLQAIARESLRDGLIAYDRRHGWRGPVAQFAGSAGWLDALAGFEQPAALDRQSVG